MQFSAFKAIFLLLILSGGVYAGEVERVELKDGSVMNAEVISMHNGVYTLKSPSLGEISVKASQVKSISASGISTSQPGSTNSDLNHIQSSLMNNPESMKLITGLQNDPDIQAVLSDPEIMKAIQNGDYSALDNNPKFQRLMNNPNIKRISGNIKQ